MKTLTQPAATSPAAPDSAAQAAWRRRVARIGSLFQLAFAALWFTRASLATGWPGRLPIAILLLWLRVTVGTPGHLTAGILLIAIPGGLALTLTGNALTAAAGYTTALILTASAIIGFRALTSGALGIPDPANPAHSHE